jgi:hypothetical protein
LPGAAGCEIAADPTLMPERPKYHRVHPNRGHSDVRRSLCGLVSTAAPLVPPLGTITIHLKHSLFSLVGDRWDLCRDFGRGRPRTHRGPIRSNENPISPTQHFDRTGLPRRVKRGRVPDRGVRAVGKWPAGATAQSLANTATVNRLLTRPPYAVMKAGLRPHPPIFRSRIRRGGSSDDL